MPPLKARFMIYGRDDAQPIIDKRGELRQVLLEIHAWTKALHPELYNKQKNILDLDITPIWQKTIQARKWPGKTGK